MAHKENTEKPKIVQHNVPRLSLSISEASFIGKAVKMYKIAKAFKVLTAIAHEA